MQPYKYFFCTSTRQHRAPIPGICVDQSEGVFSNIPTVEGFWKTSLHATVPRANKEMTTWPIRSLQVHQLKSQSESWMASYDTSPASEPIIKLGWIPDWFSFLIGRSWLELSFPDIPCCMGDWKNKTPSDCHCQYWGSTWAFRWVHVLAKILCIFTNNSIGIDASLQGSMATLCVRTDASVQQSDMSFG